MIRIAAMLSLSAAPVMLFALGGGSDDPVLCSGYEHRFEDQKGHLSPGAKQAMARSLESRCPQLAAYIRTTVPPPPPAPATVAPPPPAPAARAVTAPPAPVARNYTPRPGAWPPPAAPPIQVGDLCTPRIVRVRGLQRGQATQALLQPGNTNCVEAEYGGTLIAEVDLCGGREVSISGISLERNGFANGRKWSSTPIATYELIGSDGQATLPQRIGTGGYSQHPVAQFPPQRAVAARISLVSRRTVGYEIDEQLCSIRFQQEP